MQILSLTVEMGQNTSFHCTSQPPNKPSLMGEMKNVYKVFIGNPERESPLGIPSCRWEAL
jgi:hypothetical protein